MANPTPSSPNPSRPTTSNPHDVTRPLSGSGRPAAPSAPGTRSAAAPGTATTAGQPARREVSQPSSAGDPRLRSGSAADPLTQEVGRTDRSAKGQHDAAVSRRRDDQQASERATQLRNERATNVEDPELSDFMRRATPATQASCSRINALVGRLGELVGTPPAASARPGQDPNAKAKAEYERVRGLITLELNYLSSIGKDPKAPLPEPPAEPKLRL